MGGTEQSNSGSSQFSIFSYLNLRIFRIQCVSLSLSLSGCGEKLWNKLHVHITQRMTTALWKWSQSVLIAPWWLAAVQVRNPSLPHVSRWDMDQSKKSFQLVVITQVFVQVLISSVSLFITSLCDAMEMGWSIMIDRWVWLVIGRVWCRWDWIQMSKMAAFCIRDILASFLDGERK